MKLDRSIKLANRFYKYAERLRNEDFQDIDCGNIVQKEAKKEWVEEIKPVLEEGDSGISQRFPGLTLETIDASYPYLKNPNSFAAYVSRIDPIFVDLEEMKGIYNHSLVYEALKDKEAGKPTESIQDSIVKEFKGMKTDVDEQGKTYPKDASYLRWLNTMRELGVSNITPPILIKLPDGRLAHVSGHTRQTAAVSSNKRLPYVILQPV